MSAAKSHGQDEAVYSVADQIGDISVTRPHVVILGAGASRAASPKGDRFRRILPLMNDFSRVVPIGDILREAGFDPEAAHFEELYSRLAVDPSQSRLKNRLERLVYDYFDGLKLPSRPTLYDHLLLSLRWKDVIATFNWDPFILDAAVRNRIPAHRLPTILFLHGNVRTGYCPRDRVHGHRDADCSRCGRTFERSKLLYPVLEKDYEHDEAIWGSWQRLKQALKAACYVTVFGYSAPTSDKSAIALIQEGWGPGEQRELEQFEIINTESEDKLRKTWGPFLCSHHYSVRRSFYESSIANHPRRTAEVWWSQFLRAKFVQRNSIPRRGGLRSLHRWYEPLIEAEDRAGDRRPQRPKNQVEHNAG